MGTFVEFIESESFFPVLILLLVLLMFVFASILMSGKKNQRKRIQERKKIKIDESAQVQLVQERGSTNIVKKEEKMEIETGSTEVNLFLEQEDQVENVDIAEVENLKMEDTTKVQRNSLIEPVSVKKAEVNYVDLSDIEVEVKPFITEEEDLNNQYRVPKSEVLNENVNSEQIIDVEPTKQVDKQADIGEEIEIPSLVTQDESNEISVIEEKKQQIDNNAFDIKPNDNTVINESVKVDIPTEYTSDKTEILDFPDFDSINQDTDIEEKIIAAANKYIESIMNR